MLRRSFWKGRFVTIHLCSAIEVCFCARSCKWYCTVGHLKEYQLCWQFLTFWAILWNCHVQDSSHEENYNSRVTALFLLFHCVWPSLKLTDKILRSNCRNAKKSHRKVLWNFLWNLKRQRIPLFWFLKILASFTNNSQLQWFDY